MSGGGSLYTPHVTGANWVSIYKDKYIIIVVINRQENMQTPVDLQASKIRMAEDWDKWRKYVHGVVEDG